MTPENQKKYDAKLKRITEAVKLKEPDMIPITLSAELFPVFNAGYTVAEVVYDATMEKMKNALLAMDWRKSVLLLMSSGNFDGINLNQFGEKIISLQA